MINHQQAKLVLHKALDYGKSIDIPFLTKAEAVSFRFMLYSVRKRERREGAKYHGISTDNFKSQFDKFHFSIEELEDGRVAVRIQEVNLFDLNIICTETGEQLELDLGFESTASQLERGTSALTPGLPGIKPEDFDE